MSAAGPVELLGFPAGRNHPQKSTIQTFHILFHSLVSAFGRHIDAELVESS
jgi:hypothetical protein